MIQTYGMREMITLTICSDVEPICLNRVTRFGDPLFATFQEIVNFNVPTSQ